MKYQRKSWTVALATLLALFCCIPASQLKGNTDSARLVNISTRTQLGGTAGTPIIGFVVGGLGSQSVLVRGIGPTLSFYGVSQPVANPMLSLVSNGRVLATNDDWLASDASSMSSTGAFALPSGSLDAAFSATLSPGAYTAPMTTKDAGSGVALLEIYETSSNTPACLANASTRAFVGTGDAVLIPGFVIGGTGTLRLLIRAVGPTLASFGVTDALVNPTIALYQGTNLLASNDNWSEALNADQISSAAKAVGGFALPTDSKDAALLVSLKPGAYSALVKGAGETTGTALVELYVLPAESSMAGFIVTESLGIPTDRGVTLSLEADGALELYVEYGTSPGNYSGKTQVTTCQAGTPIRIKIESPDPTQPLQANQQYVYRVRYRSLGEEVFAAREEYHFQTRRPSGVPFTFTITADPHLDDITSPELLTTALSNIRLDTPDFNVDLGDMLMSDKLSQFIPGLKVDYQAIKNRALSFRGYFGKLCHSVPLFLTLGNHEGEYGYTYTADKTADKSNNVASWNLRARKLYFPNPAPDAFYSGSAETRLVMGTSELLENYYAWEWGDALFIVLDPYWNTLANPVANPADNWRWTLGKTQYDWLGKTLQASKARFKFVFIHSLVGGGDSARGGIEMANTYEWGGLNSDGTEGFSSHRPGWGAPIHQILRENHVSVVFHGHDHLYARQELDGIVYQECPQPGTPNFTTGSQVEGGYVSGTILPNSGHLRVSISPSGAKVDYIRAVLPSQETSRLHNRDNANSYLVSPAP